MKKLKRIVTWMSSSLAGDPIEILAGGSRTIELPSKHRVFAVRNVIYDDSLTPMYSQAMRTFEVLYYNVDKLREENNIDTVILDRDNNLMVYDEICSERQDG